ncbi:MAG: hypothetical protein K5669_04215 [Lachnospiraceae bacterium]|nr:hypothetical protein [Lachnospiraceae bacterium]
MRMRYRCPNGHVFNGDENTKVCPECSAALALENCGAIQLYRMGNMMGMAVGMGIYIDEVPYGHIGNKESIRIVLPFGDHKIHVTHSTTRNCNDPVITLSAEAPIAYMKCHLGAMGFKIVVEPANPAEMPPI